MAQRGTPGDIGVNAVQDLHAYLWQEPAVGQPPAPPPALAPAAAAGHHPQQPAGHQHQGQHPVAAAWQAQWQAVHQVNVNHHHHHHPAHHNLDAQHPPQDLPMPVSP